MQESSWENRQHVRYRSARKAVLFDGTDIGRLGVIANFSNGGIFFAVVGAPVSGDRERIQIKVDQDMVPCNVVSKGRMGLHCAFDQSIGDSVRASMHILETKAITHNPVARRGSALLPVEECRSYHLSKIYADGFLTGRQQLDPPPNDILELTVELLNPFDIREERVIWTRGFLDAVQHMARHRHESV